VNERNIKYLSTNTRLLLKNQK